MRVEESIELQAPRERVWDYLSDPANYMGFWHGLSVFEIKSDPADRLDLGTRMNLRMHAGSADIGGLAEIVEYEPPGDMAWTSITGIDMRGRWRLRDTEDGGTKVIMRIAYSAPGTFGALADRVSAPQIHESLKRTLEALKAEIEGGRSAVSEEGGRGLIGSVTHQLGSLKIIAETGLIRPVRPDRLGRMGLALVRWGRSPAAGYIAAAAAHPNEPAIIDDLGTLTFAEVNNRTDKLAHALADAGVKEGDGVGILCRNHRGFVESTIAVAKLGANSLYLNTAFAKPQLTEVCEREEPTALIYDEEFADLLSDAREGRKCFVAWHEGDGADDPLLSDLMKSGASGGVSPPSETGRTVILTSGTTGTPRGASRASPTSIEPAVSLLSKIPLSHRHVAHIAAPLFHSWGFAHFTIGLLLNSTLVLTRKFDPERTLEMIEESRAESLVVVPVMMQRIMELPEETRKKYDASSLKVVAASGSALPGDLATNWMDEFGDTLYNLYGSTEVAWATIATPADMRAAPGTAGRPPRGTVVRLYDEDGNPVKEGETGRIFVGNEMLFEGYTGGGGKDEIDGLMATGDVGRFDEEGRLFVEGRDDEMIVSGGENVFPKEVEDLLSRHDAVAEAAAFGVDDEQFGERLRAFVVLNEGASADEDDLKRYVKDNLARYKVPREIWFIDELPRNATGKVLKRELAEMEEAPSENK